MSDMNFGVNLVPTTDSSFTLGGTNKKWNLYANTINGVSAGAIIAGTIYYAACSTAASTQQKEITVSGITEFSEGLSVRIKFANAQSYNGTPTLNLNTLTAKNIYRNGATAAAQGEWAAGEILDLVYDGTQWVIVNGGSLKI